MSQSKVTKKCVRCGNEFPIWIEIEGIRRSLTNRESCLGCVPFGERRSYRSSGSRGLLNSWDLDSFDECKKYDFYYLVGVVATDGCLSSSGGSVIIVQKDRFYLESIKNRFGIKANVAEHKNGKGLISYHLQIGSVELYRKLEGIGLTPKKSKTIGELCIPKEYRVSFLRGVFDGDGCITGFDNNGNIQWVWKLMSASKLFIDYLRNLIFDEFNVDSEIYKNRMVYVIQYGAGKAEVIIRKLYAQGILSLERKKLRCEELVKYRN